MLNRTCSEFDVITHSVVEKFPPAKNGKKKIDSWHFKRKGLTCEEKKEENGFEWWTFNRGLCESTVTFYLRRPRALEGKSYPR